MHWMSFEPLATGVLLERLAEVHAQQGTHAVACPFDGHVDDLEADGLLVRRVEHHPVHGVVYGSQGVVELGLCGIEVVVGLVGWVDVVGDDRAVPSPCGPEYLGHAAVAAGRVQDHAVNFVMRQQRPRLPERRLIERRRCETSDSSVQ